jgi:hypothetical protein
MTQLSGGISKGRALVDGEKLNIADPGVKMRDAAASRQRAAGERSLREKNESLKREDAAYKK